MKKRILICSSNKDNKVCENDSVFADTFDTILISHINQIIRNKDDFINFLRKAFSSHPGIINLNSNLVQTQGKLSELDSKLRLLITSDDELDKQVKDQLIELQTKLQLELVGYQNKSLTTHNINNRLKYYKLLLRDYNKSISEISEFPFKKLFERVVIHNRNDIEFIIQFDDDFNSNAIDQFQMVKT
jgi:hypothetical protein